LATGRIELIYVAEFSHGQKYIEIPGNLKAGAARSFPNIKLRPKLCTASVLPPIINAKKLKTYLKKAVK
jgi:hypothetical protein